MSSRDARDLNLSLLTHVGTEASRDSIAAVQQYGGAAKFGVCCGLLRFCATLMAKRLVAPYVPPYPVNVAVNAYDSGDEREIPEQVLVMCT